MDYQQTVNWRFDQRPVYQVDGFLKYKVDLKPIIRVCNNLDNPQNNFKSIHVAGTNGKGSSSHMISSVLQEAGYSVGLSTSPHLKDFSERLKLNGEEVAEKFVVTLVERTKEFYDRDQEEISKRIKGLGVENDLIKHDGLTPGMLVTLGEQKILTLTDLADLASDELTGTYDIVKGERVKIQGYLEDFALSKEESDELIMSARNIVYKDWVMSYWKKNKINNYWHSQKID